MPASLLLFATPFRIFFLMAAVLAAGLVPLWLAVLSGSVAIRSHLPLLWWHGHEMIFGFVGAVLAGFLLTAVRNWTQRMTLQGAGLGALFVVWAAGRGLGFAGTGLPWWLELGVDAAFYGLLAVGIGQPIFAARSQRNYAFPLLIAAMGCCDAVLHLAAAGIVPWAYGARAMMAALDAVLLILFIFAGRVVPMFTANAVGKPARRKGALDWLGLGSLAIFACARLGWPDETATAVFGIVAGGANGARLVGWNGMATVRQPILWVLHLGWLLTSLGIAALGLAHFVPALKANAALHLLTVGGLSVLVLGMMARVSLGHTGRKLVVPSVVAVGFGVLLLAAAVRVAAPFLEVRSYLDALWLSAIGWSVAFAVFALRYAPILGGPRVDGKPG